MNSIKNLSRRQKSASVKNGYRKSVMVAKNFTIKFKGMGPYIQCDMFLFFLFWMDHMDVDCYFCFM